MKAALVETFNQVPQYKEVQAPIAKDGEQLVTVLASPVNHLVQARANGTHYSSDASQLPFIPGVDGVGKLANGQLVYFMANGPLAEKVAVNEHRMIPIPANVDANKVAAAMNPATSSWMAIKQRLGDIKGKKVMILGATGAAGSVAIEISRYLGASEVVAVGRNQEKLNQLDADQKIWLGNPDADLKANADVDVVLDYLWGEVTEQFLPIILQARTDHSQPLNWVEIGSMAGADIKLPAAFLRSTALTLLGSGMGSVPARAFVKELPELAQLISEGHFNVPIEVAPLSQVSEMWLKETGKRLVFNPGK